MAMYRFIDAHARCCHTCNTQLLGGAMTLTVRLDPEQEQELEQLAADTGRTKSYYVKKAIGEFLEDRADYLTALAALEQDDGSRHSLADLRRELGI